MGMPKANWTKSKEAEACDSDGRHTARTGPHVRGALDRKLAELPSFSTILEAHFTF